MNDIPAPALTTWPAPDEPTRHALESIFRDERLSPSWWSNGPNDRYGEHSHPYHKVLYCASGNIRFICADEAIDLSPGDRLDIPPGIVHSAVVGPNGVTCVEAARS